MTPRVLIVDDALFMRRLLRDIFERDGWEVVGEVDSGDRVLPLYRELRPDLVTLDIVMPGRNGLDVLWELMQEDPQARVIMCSALGQEPLILRAVQYGARDFVVKPIQEDRLLQVAHRVLAPDTPDEPRE